MRTCLWRLLLYMYVQEIYLQQQIRVYPSRSPPTRIHLVVFLCRCRRLLNVLFCLFPLFVSSLPVALASRPSLRPSGCCFCCCCCCGCCLFTWTALCGFFCLAHVWGGNGNQNNCMALIKKLNLCHCQPIKLANNNNKAWRKGISAKSFAV